MRSLQAIILALLVFCLTALTHAANQPPSPSGGQQSPQQINDPKPPFGQGIDYLLQYLKSLLETPSAAQLAWPAVVASLFLLAWFSGLRHVLPRLNSIKLLNGTEIRIRDLEACLEQEIKKTVDILAHMFPPGKADKYLPSPQPDLDYYIHVVEFLDTIRVPLTNPVVVWNAVGAYYFDRDREKSRKAFERAKAHDPNDPSPYTTLGMWHLRINQDVHAAHAQFTESVRLAKSKGVPCPWAHVGLAAVARDTGNEDKHKAEIKLAEDAFNRALAADASDYWSLHGLGWCSFHKENFKEEKIFEEAKQYMKKAIQLMPKFDAAHYNLACVYARQKCPERAVDALKHLVGEAKIKLEHLGVHTEKDFEHIQDHPAFKQFFATFGLVYKP